MSVYGLKKMIKWKFQKASDVKLIEQISILHFPKLIKIKIVKKE